MLSISLELVRSGLAWSQNLAEFDFSLFITREWIESFAGDNKQPVYFNFYNLNEIVAKIAGLVISLDRFRGKNLYFFSGPAMKTSDSSLYLACIKSLITYARDYRMNRIIFRSYDYSTLIEEPIPWLKISNREEFILDLNPDKDTLIHNMGKKVVKNYKKALNLGGTPQDHTHEGISAFKLSLGCKAVSKSGFSTNYLFMPYSIMNPILNLGRKLPDIKFFQSLKKYV